MKKGNRTIRLGGKERERKKRLCLGVWLHEGQTHLSAQLKESHAGSAFLISAHFTQGYTSSEAEHGTIGL